MRLISSLVLLLLSNVLYAQTFYVSANGTSSECSLDSPCQITTAQLAVRNILASGQTEHITVFLKEGNYTLTETITLTPKDSGQKNYRVTWQNMPNQRPVLTSGKTISNWSLHDKENNIWAAKVEGNQNFRQLWINDQRAQRARSVKNPSNYAFNGTELTSSTLPISSLTNPEHIEIEIHGAWRQLFCPVTSWDSTSLKTDHDCRWKHFLVDKQTYNVIGHPFVILFNYLAPVDYYIANALQFLDEDNEWYLDQKQGTVYYKPSPSIDMSNAMGSYPSLTQLFHLKGEQNNPIKNITIKGLSFEHSKETRLDKTAHRLEKQYIPSIVHVDYGSNIQILDNSIKHTGSHGILFNHGGNDLRISGNTLSDIGFSGIFLAQTDLEIICCSDKTTEQLAANSSKYYKNVTISNNLIRNVGNTTDDAEYNHGISFSTYTDNIIITHNDLRYIPGKALASQWYHGANKKILGRVTYSWNRIKDAITGVEVDTGAIYLAASNLHPAQIHHNYLVNHTVGYGIYLDVFVEKANIYRNIIVTSPRLIPFSIPYLHFIPGGSWITFILSQGNHAHNNWTNRPEFYASGTVGTISGSSAALTGYVHTQENIVEKNTPILPEGLFEMFAPYFTPGAVKVIEGAGLEPEYKHLLDAL
jgi:hypothetical protein